MEAQQARPDLVVFPERCTGCRMCEMACSRVKEGRYWPALSRIRVVRDESACLSVPLNCAQCEKQVCVDVCPTGAMHVDPATGFGKVDESSCLGCKECVVACPFGAAGLHPERRTAFRCDLCDGDPECVKVCYPGALVLMPLGRATAVKRRGAVQARGLVRL